MKCTACDGRGYFPVSNITAKICPQCNGTGKLQMTKEKWFCNLSTKEKAKFLEGLIIYCFGIGHTTESEYEKYKELIDDVEKWLNSPHEE